MEGSDNAGYAVQDPRAFEAEQKEAHYRWMVSAPDFLDITDNEFRETSRATRSAIADRTVHTQGERIRMAKAPQTLERPLLWLKGLLKTILVPAIPTLVAGLIVSYRQDIWHFFKQL